MVNGLNPFLSQRPSFLRILVLFQCRFSFAPEGISLIRIVILFPAIILLLLSSGCNSNEDCTKQQRDNFSQIRASLQKRIEPAKCKEIELIPIQQDNGIFVAVYHHMNHWAEDAVLLRYREKQIEWTTRIPQTAQSIPSVKKLQLKGFTDPIIEIIEETHQGNGFLCLYRIEDKQLHPLLQTKLLDQGTDGIGFRGGRIKNEYRDMNSDGFDDVLLSGLIDHFNDDNESSRPDLTETYQKIFFWNQLNLTFAESIPIE